MKRKFLLLIILVCCAATGFAQTTNIYASGLKLGAPSGGNIPVSYFLNTDATELAFNFVQDGQIKASVAITEASLLTKGAHQTTVSLNAAPAGEYNWSMTAKAGDIAAPIRYSDASPQFRYYMPMGLAIDNSFESPYLGQIYVGEGGSSIIISGKPDYWEGTGRATYDGIYVFSPALDDLNPEGDCYFGNLEWTSGGNVTAIPYDAYSPGRIAVGVDGKVYIADKSTTNSGIYVMDPALRDPAHNDTPFTPVFAEGERSYYGVVGYTHGPVAAIAVDGAGENTTIYTIDHWLLPEGYEARQYINGMVFKYEVGNLSTPYSGTPTIIYDNPESKLANAAMNLALDGRGGLWACQYRATDNATIPSLMHFTKDGVVDYTSDGLLGDTNASQRGAMAVNPAGTLLAVGSNRLVRIFEIAYNESGVPTLTERTDLALSLNANNIEDVAFDVAGNVYAVSASTELFYAYGVPKAGGNVFTTPAPSAQKITATGSGIQKPSLYSVRIANNGNQISILTDGLKIKSYKLYNIAGGLVASGFDKTSGAIIPTDRLATGVYQIQIVTNEGTVVKRFVKK
jgi:hypothetical protein